ncbi:S41 family peptidase, partial [Anoxybacillus sp.]|uniref:S41 family peptidase n=1 Tax=Anoxybacillus sp. TaxID=1872573 RepID=UPI00262F6183
MRRLFVRLLLSVFLLCIFPSLTFAHTLSEEEKLERVRFYVENYYYKQVVPDVLQQHSIQSMMEKLDPYSNYMTYEEFQEFLNSISPSVSGVGIYVEEDELGLRIVDIFTDSDVERKGLQVGDIIVQIDGHVLQHISFEDAVSYLQGEAGTYVQLRVYRPSTNEYFTIVTQRQTFDIPLVFHKKLAGHIGYIALFSFDENVADEVQHAIADLGEVNEYIVDLRYNGGGYIDAALKVIGLFPNVPNATWIKSRDEQEMMSSIVQPVQFSKPVSLLVNA